MQAIPVFLTEKLNSPQRDAVMTLDGPLLILAGAGSGKTRVLTHRVAAIVASGKASEDEILCVTFTNKASREMESRIFQLLSDMNVIIHGEMWINTFHSFCVRVLKKHLTLLHYKPFFTIYDSSDQLAQIKKVCQQLNINDKMFPPKSFQSRISFAKMNGLTPEAISKGNRSTMDAKTLDVFKHYEQEMKKANALDFDDLLLKTHELFLMYPDLLKDYQEKFKYIMVDEYQDTNHIQYLIVKMLAQSHRNLCVVGDEDQSIYSWRGADIKNILDFEQDFNEAKVVKLEENYRSTNNIVQAATAVIKNNQQRKDKTLFTHNHSGDLISLQEERNEYDEARFVIKSIQTMISEGEGTYQDYAVFYRTNSQSRVLEEQLRTFSIPIVSWGVRFYERMEIKDILGYLKISLNPADDMAVKKNHQCADKGIGKATFEKVEALSFENKITLLQGIQKAIDSKIFNSGTTSKLRRFLDLLETLRGDSTNFKLNDFYHLVLEKTEYLKALKSEDTTEAEARIDNLEELDNAITQFMKERGEEATLQSFLEEMALVSDADQLNQELNSVTLMTLHISKGLEYPYVFIVGLEESLFPSLRHDDNSEEDMEEERRLAYVGMTRARKKLFLTYARTRKIWGQDQVNPPSRFLKEIPKELIQFKTSTGSSFVQKYSHRSHGFAENESFFESNSFTHDKRKPKNIYSDSGFEDQSFPDEGLGKSKSFRKGMRVKHPTFGTGSVFETEGDGDMLKVSVLFSDQTIKKFVVKYARLEIV